MRLVIQRTIKARVLIEEKVTAEIGYGLVILMGVVRGDTESDADYLAAKVSKLRIFKDEAGKMNLSLAQMNGSLLLVPNFTLAGDCSRGNRPGFDQAAAPDAARQLFDYFADLFMNTKVIVRKGSFGADMKIELINDGRRRLWWIPGRYNIDSYLHGQSTEHLLPGRRRQHQ